MDLIEFYEASEMPLYDENEHMMVCEEIMKLAKEGATVEKFEPLSKFGTDGLLHVLGTKVQLAR